MPRVGLICHIEGSWASSSGVGSPAAAAPSPAMINVNAHSTKRRNLLQLGILWRARLFEVDVRGEKWQIDAKSESSLGHRDQRPHELS